MGFKEADFPPVDPPAFLNEPLRDRVRTLSTHWAEYGFGTPKMVHVIYLVKIAVLYLVAGISLATLTSGLNPLHISDWWNEPIVYQKLILWTVLLEAIGIAGSWGMLAGKFKPQTGGILFWARPGTIRMAPWPDKVPGTGGDSRTVFDVVVYLAFLANLLVGVAMPGRQSASFTEAMANTPLDVDASHGLINPVILYPLLVLWIVLGLRDKVAFLGSRAEQYLPAVVFFAFLPFTNMIIAAKLLIVIVWIGAGVSKIGKHFTNVIPPMISNTPWLTIRAIKRMNYRNFPNDLRPSKLASFQGHVLGTLVEIVTPLVLLFSGYKWLTLAAVVLMVCFHLFIFSTFPLAVPLEWNLLFAFLSVFLFWGYPSWEGFGVADFSPTWLLILLAAALLVMPVLGNLRPDLVSFLPSLRQYAGNWASAMWAFTPGAEEKLNSDAIVRPAKNNVTQLEQIGYEPEIAEITMQQTIGWRSMHSQGRGLYSVLYRELGEDAISDYTIREGEFACNSMLGFNFGDGHFHNWRLIEAIQKRVGFEPGEFTVVWVESQPIHKKTQEYMVIDAALGIIERGTWNVADAVEEQPWLPNGPIPINVTWRSDRVPSRSTVTGKKAPKRQEVTQP
ncbi:MAG: DUF3556 domain-containing protein [Gordonia sp. (in: high G+C Gram-positive bacteria)]|uniref:DUF3556 domain-containing protein n=1 Tax=Gordonia sp. (in: high G+C Gram-positive bacteria) TaxID=84139 RepID=UPI0039E52B0F